MFLHRSTVRTAAQAIVAAALGAALLAGPAGARPADHDSVAPSTGPVATYHDSIAPSTGTSPVAAYHDSVAPSTSAPTVVAYHDSISPSSSPSGGSGDSVTSFASNPKVFAAANNTTNAGTSGSDLPWAAIGAGLLAAALCAFGISALRGRSHTPRPRSSQGKPSFS